MAALSLSIDAIKPLNRWDRASIRPGPVGSIGDCLTQVRLKHSYPDAALRWDSEFSGRNEPRTGANVSDGQYQSYTSNGGPSNVEDSNWGSRRSFKINHGWHYQDMRAPDRNVEPVLGPLPQYTWHNKIATVYKAQTTGNQFLPLPGGYANSPGEVTRGGMYPRVTAIEGVADNDIYESSGADPNPNFLQDSSTGAPVVRNSQKNPNFLANASSFGPTGRNSQKKRGYGLGM